MAQLEDNLLPGETLSGRQGAEAGARPGDTLAHLPVFPGTRGLSTCSSLRPPLPTGPPPVQPLPFSAVPPSWAIAYVLRLPAATGESSRNIYLSASAGNGGCCGGAAGAPQAPSRRRLGLGVSGRHLWNVGMGPGGRDWVNGVRVESSYNPFSYRINEAPRVLRERGQTEAAGGPHAGRAAGEWGGAGGLVPFWGRSQALREGRADGTS